MDPTKPGPITTDEELEKLLTDAVTPLDIDALVRAGVLETRGIWYVILNLNEMPLHAKSQIKAIRQSKNKEVLVKFRPVSKRTEKLFKSYTASKKKD